MPRNNASMAAEAQQPVVRCPQCNADSSIAKNYCADCGAPLEAGGYRQLIRAEVATVLADRLKDKQVVEVELFDSVVERLLKYLKWFSAALALPLAVTGIGLTFFGFQKVHDVNSLAEKVDREVKPKAESALHDADEASNAASQAKHSAEEVTIQVNKELASARNITPKSRTSHLKWVDLNLKLP